MWKEQSRLNLHSRLSEMNSKFCRFFICSNFCETSSFGKKIKRAEALWNQRALLYNETHAGQKNMFQKDWPDDILEWLDALRGQKITIQRSFKRTSLCLFETNAICMKKQSLADNFKNIDLTAKVNKLAGRVAVQQVTPGATPGIPMKMSRVVFPLAESTPSPISSARPLNGKFEIFCNTTRRVVPYRSTFWTWMAAHILKTSTCNIFFLQWCSVFTSICDRMALIGNCLRLVSRDLEKTWKIRSFEQILVGERTFLGCISSTSSCWPSERGFSSRGASHQYHSVYLHSLSRRASVRALTSLREGISSRLNTIPADFLSQAQPPSIPREEPP